MNYAIKFVKDFGVDQVKSAVSVAGKDVKHVVWRGVVVEIDDLKQIVEAFELIEKDFESIEMADYEHMVSGCYSDPYWIKVKKAVDLVAQCQ